MFDDFREHLLRLQMSDLSLVEVAEWLSDKMTADICLSKGQSEVRLFHCMLLGMHFHLLHLIYNCISRIIKEVCWQMV